MESTREFFMRLIVEERVKQDLKWGFPQQNKISEWGIILGEEFGEVIKEINELHYGRKTDNTGYIRELIQLAAVCVSMLEHEVLAGDFDIELEKPITLTEKEYHFVRAFDEGWIAMDKKGGTFLHPVKPIKGLLTWVSNSWYFELPAEMFPFIQWTDDEPWSIAQLRELDMEVKV